MNGKLISEYSWEGTVILIDLLEMVKSTVSPCVFSINLNKFTITELSSNVMLQEPCSKHAGSQSCQQTVCVSTVVSTFSSNKTNRSVTYLKMF